MPTTDWNPILRDEFERPYWQELQAFVAEERTRGPVYPPADDVFRALHLTSFASVRVVILGQDPYHGPGQAHGLAFSVAPPVPPPPSLTNIFKELQADLGVAPPTTGSLERWAEQGVLLLNTVLTVRSGEAGSHRNKGWEHFSDRVIEAVNGKDQGVVFLLWGAAARAKAAMIDQDKHTIIESPHPSPLSAHRGFLGSRPFSRTNAALTEVGAEPIAW